MQVWENYFLLLVFIFISLNFFLEKILSLLTLKIINQISYIWKPYRNGRLFRDISIEAGK